MSFCQSLRKTITVAAFVASALAGAQESAEQNAADKSTIDSLEELPPCGYESAESDRETARCEFPVGRSFWRL